jgi:glycerol-1-phosphate dehydrogenase [NAD(P)+]
MVLDGVKVSISSKCPNAIIGDIDVLRAAPEKMLASGLGDMLAKYVSVAEWRISNLINGEYYCEKVANDMKKALFDCVKNTDKLFTRDEESVEAVFRGLVASGCAMEYAGVSRPASGVEHYISHVLDMRGIEFGSSVETHGIQCAVATLTASRLYHTLKSYKPDIKKALSYVESFDFAAWADTLRGLLGKAAEPMIAAEAKDGKYDKEKHKERIKNIIDNWDKIVSIIEEEIPTPKEIERLLTLLKLPFDVCAIEPDKTILPTVFKATKDIRDKYVLSRLLWDLGIIDEYADMVV